jgi:hypothetical protein
VIVLHHGGELALLQAALAFAGSVPVLVVLFRTEIVGRLGRHLRRRWAAGAMHRSDPETFTAGEASERRLSRNIRQI